MKTFRISVIILIGFYILETQGFEAKSHHHHEHGNRTERNRTAVPQHDYPEAMGYIVKADKNFASNIKKNLVESSIEDKFQSSFSPSSSGRVQFRVRANNKVSILLSCGNGQHDNKYEIFIGPWDNAELDRLKPKYRGYWVHWNNGTIIVGNEGDTTPFTNYTDSKKAPIEYVGVTSGRGAVSSCTVQLGGEGHWVAADHGKVPPGAYIGGQELGEPMYVIRAHFGDGLLPGKLLSSHRKSFVTLRGYDNPCHLYEVLCDFDGNWQESSKNDEIPRNAVVAGVSADRSVLYVGRVMHEGALTTGKVEDGSRVCYIPYRGQEISFDKYEILVY